MSYYGRRSEMDVRSFLGWVLVFFGLVVTVTLTLIFLVAIWWGIERSTTAPLNRAQVAAEAEEVLKWMREVDKGMNEWGMTKGHSTILKHTPDYDYGAIHQSVLNIISRLERTVEMNKKSQEYQSAMDDIRGMCRELNLRIETFAFKHYGWWMILLGLGLGILPQALGMLMNHNPENPFVVAFIIEIVLLLVALGLA